MYEITKNGYEYIIHSQKPLNPNSLLFAIPLLKDKSSQVVMRHTKSFKTVSLTTSIEFDIELLHNAVQKQLNQSFPSLTALESTVHSQAQERTLERVDRLHHFNIDFDVYLPTKNRNLQRGDVWTLQQKQSLIFSMLCERPIPRISVIEIVDDEMPYKIQVVDGKQRLKSILTFVDNQFHIEFNGCYYFFKDLPQAHQNRILHYHIGSFCVYDYGDNNIADAFKIEWFDYLNFSGTPHVKP